MKHFRLVVALAALAFAPTLAKADPITYTFNQSLVQSATDFFTVTGTLTTDGKLGTITTGDITTFDLFLNETLGNQTPSVELSPALAGYLAVGGSGYFTAAVNTLSFDFSQANNVVFFGGYGTGVMDFLPGQERSFVPPFPTVVAPESGVQVVATVVSPTPEPSSLLLLGTGALGLAGAVRRRIVRA